MYGKLKSGVFQLKRSFLSVLYSQTVSCGFPSPADDYLETPLDLNELLIKKPSSTFFVRAKGDSMVGAGIFSGDLLIIDRSVTPQHRQIVLAVINGDFTLKRFLKTDGKIILAPENPKYRPLEVHEGVQFEVWGVLTAVIHQFL